MKSPFERLRGFWLAPLPLLGLGTGWLEPAVAAAAVLTVAEIVALMREGSSPDPARVQARMACVLLLVLGSVPPFGVLHALLGLVGVAQILSGRCALVAALRAAPWNRPVVVLGVATAMGG